MRRYSVLQRVFLLLIAAVLFSASVSAAEDVPELAGEHITDFDSSAVVAPDGSVTFTESITVLSLGNEIRRGIVREIPFVYLGTDGTKRVTSFELVKAELDGAPTQSNVDMSGGVASIRLGSPNRLLQRGLHTFTITYRTAGWVAFRGSADELYWNVTGNGWAWPIERASFSIELPEGASVTETNVYTGLAGERGTNFSVMSENRVETVSPLMKGEGLTVSFAWPKGFVSVPPDGAEDRNMMITLMLLFVGGYFLLSWLICGRDPNAGPLVPQWTLPFGIGPGLAACIRDMEFSPQTLAAEVLQLAVCGAVKIRESGGKLSAEKTKDFDSAVNVAMKFDKHIAAAAAELFPSDDKLQFDGSSGKRLYKAQNALKSAIKAESGSMIKSNGRLIKIGYFLLAMMAMSGMGMRAEALEDECGMAVLAAIAMIAVEALSLPLMRILSARMKIRATALNFGRLMPAIAAVLFLLVWAAGFVLPDGYVRHIPIEWAAGWIVLTAACSEIVTRASVAQAGSADAAEGRPRGSTWAMMFLASASYCFAVIAHADLVLLAVMTAMFCLGISFAALMPSRTKEGAKLARHIDGLIMYMNAAERGRLEMLNPPDETPEMFERLLPYAYALGCAETWANRFEKILADASYSPEWYASSAHFSAGSFTRLVSPGLTGGIRSSISSYTSSLVSSSSSGGGYSGSSGMGGGGSSGGGGGGGGGHGW